MGRLYIQSPSEQVAAHLREQLLSGEIEGRMPGTPLLSERLGVDRKTIIAALNLLGQEGLLAAQGAGKRRRIMVPEGRVGARQLKVAILLYQKGERNERAMLGLRYQLREAGFGAFFASRALRELKLDVGKVDKMVKENDADAWVVVSGSREVLQWFSEQTHPVFALYGRHLRLAIAASGPSKSAAITEAVKRLAGLGHRRIVYLVREERRKPEPGLLERSFLSALEDCGIQTGAFHLPDWEDNRAGFHRMLDSLFRHSPPTAMIVDTAPLFAAARDHLASKGIIAPRHVSLICTDPDATFEWCEPAVSHFRWDPSECIRHVVRWAENIAHGKDDRRKNQSKAEFVEAGTVGTVGTADFYKR